MGSVVVAPQTKGLSEKIKRNESVQKKTFRINDYDDKNELIILEKAVERRAITMAITA